MFFVENNNLHPLPSHCTGVAYSPSRKRITMENDVLDHHHWFLGTIIFHTYDIVTYIAPTEVRKDCYNKDAQSWISDNNVLEYNIKFKQSVLLRQGEFKLHYINVVEYKQNQGYDCIKASLHGPDTAPRTAEMKR
jgi:hypothetical protein